MNTERAEDAGVNSRGVDHGLDVGDGDQALLDGKHFMVLPVPSWVPAGGPGFGFQVNHGGGDVCMELQPRATTP